MINSWIREKGKSKAFIDGENERLKTKVEKKCMKDVSSKDLDMLWDDGHRTKTMKDCLDGAKEMIKLDGEPPKRFAPLNATNL